MNEEEKYMLQEEEYELQQEYLTPRSERQQNILRDAVNTDKAVETVVNGKISDIIHDLVFKHPVLSKKLFEELQYYKDKNII